MSNQNIPPEEPGQNQINANEDKQSPPALQLIDTPQTPPTNTLTATNDQTEPPMEVHHHGHVHEKKKWKEYLFQFLMLFLAVFCGFLAENQREHYVENLREKQFISSLVNDIKVDTARLNQLIENRNTRESKLDSLTFLINSDNADQYTRDIYFLATTIPRITLFQFTANDGTMQQLKNAGGLRLIRSHSVTDNIINYDNAIRSLNGLNDQEQSIINIQREIAPKILIGLELGDFTDSDNLPVRVNRSPALMPGYKTSVNEFNYRLVSVKNINKGYRREARKLLLQATDLLSVLKKQYHLD